MNFSIYSERLFPVRNLANNKEWLSLQEIIVRDDVIKLDYPMQLINVFGRFLLTGLIEAALSSKNVTLDKKIWNALVNNQPWPDECIQAITNPPDGFDLFGDVAFLQMPNELFEEREQKPVEQLLQPFQVSGDTTKGLRQGGEKIDCLCPSCALIGLYTQHFYTAAVAKYWSTSAVNSALLLSPSLSNSSLRATLALHLINADTLSYYSNRKQLSPESYKPMPWVPDDSSSNRWTPEQSLPLEKWLNPEQQRGHLTDMWLPLIRAIRLGYEEIVETEQCDFCGNVILPEQVKVGGFYAKGEDDIFKKLSDPIRKIYIEKTALYKAKFKSNDDENAKSTSSFTFNRLYRQELRHPALGYRKINGESARLLAESFKNNYTNRKPHWADLFGINGLDNPILLKQLSGIDNKELKIGIEVAGLGYKKGRDIDSVTSSTYSFDLLEPIFKDIYAFSNEEFAEPLIRNINNLSSRINVLKEKRKASETNSLLINDKHEASQGLQIDLNVISQIKTQIIEKDCFNGSELIKKADEIEQLTIDFNAKLFATEKLEDKSIQTVSTAANKLSKEIQQIHAHYAKDLIEHVQTILKALQAAGDMLSQKIEADPDNNQKPYKIVPTKKSDNQLIHAPQFLVMADTIWKSALDCLVTISKQKGISQKQERLFIEKKQLSEKGMKLLEGYLKQFPSNATELMAGFLENQAMITYNEHVYGKNHERKFTKKR